MTKFFAIKVRGSCAKNGESCRAPDGCMSSRGMGFGSLLVQLNHDQFPTLMEARFERTFAIRIDGETAPGQGISHGSCHRRATGPKSDPEPRNSSKKRGRFFFFRREISARRDVGAHAHGYPFDSHDGYEMRRACLTRDLAGIRPKGWDSRVAHDQNSRPTPPVNDHGKTTAWLANPQNPGIGVLTTDATMTT